MKIYDRVLSEIKIPIGVEIELEDDEFLWLQSDRGIVHENLQWLCFGNKRIKITKETK